MKKKIIAILLSVSLVLATSAIAFAADETVAGDVEHVSVDGETKTIEVDDNSPVEGNSLVIDGNVTTSDEEYSGGSVKVSGGSTLEVTGDVTGGSGDASNTVAVGGCTDESGNNTVEIGGNVTAGNDIVDALQVNGDNNKVTIDGNVKGGPYGIAIEEGENNEIVIGGDVEGKSGIMIMGDNKVAVEGTVKGTQGTAISIYESESEPTILAFKTDGEVKSYRFDDSTSDFVYSDASDKVNYILVKESDKITGYESGSTPYTVNGKTYDTAKEGASVVIKVAEGYGVKAGTIEVTKNADGTFTLVVPKGGGVTITAEAIQEAVKEAEENGKGEAKVDDNKDKSEKKPDVKPTKKSDNSKQDDDDDDNNSNPAAIPQLSAGSKTVATLGNVTRTTVDPSSGNYSARVVELIANVPAGGTLNLDITSSAYLDTAIINALAARSDVSLNLTVNYLGVPFTLSIPAGYNLLALMGADGKIDFAKLIETFPPKAK